jgi:hypothetical protein
MVVFESVFRLEMYKNNMFLIFLKIIFNIIISNYSKNTKKILI